jgi:hypothetical protein
VKRGWIQRARHVRRNGGRAIVERWMKISALLMTWASSSRIIWRANRPYDNNHVPPSKWGLPCARARAAPCTSSHIQGSSQYSAGSFTVYKTRLYHPSPYNTTPPPGLTSHTPHQHGPVQRPSPSFLHTDLADHSRSHSPRTLPRRSSRRRSSMSRTRAARLSASSR